MTDTQSNIINANFSYLNNKIKEIELIKSPNALIVGEPTINNGQVTGLSKTNYLILPFQFDPKDRGFELTYCFRTVADVTTPQNLYGSKFSIASYVQNGKLTIRVSSNGTSWNVLDLITSLDVQPNTTYYIKLIFNRLNYTVKASTDGVEYSQIGYVVNTGAPFAGDVYIGIGNNQNNPFLGMINLHKWELKYNNSVFWEGMDDAGLATRADISLSNLDEEGEGRFNAKQDTLIAGDNITIENNVISSAGGAVDNKSITKNTDNQIQAVGTINQNTAVGATAVKYDWIGTLAEYNSQGIATSHPEWICFITDDVSGGNSVYTKSEVDELVNDKAGLNDDNVFTGTNTFDKKINGKLFNYNDSFANLSTNFNIKEDITTTRFYPFKISDNARNDISYIEVETVGNGQVRTALCSKTYKEGGSSVIAQIGTLVARSGLATTFATPSETGILTTLDVVKERDGMMRLGNGFLFQWGKMPVITVNSGGNYGTVNFKYPYTYADSYVVMTSIRDGGPGFADFTLNYNEYTTTSFNIGGWMGGGWTGELGIDWFAIGF